MGAIITQTHIHIPHETQIVIRKEKRLTQAELCAKLNLLGWDISRETFTKLKTQVRWVADFELLHLAKRSKWILPNFFAQAEI